MRYMMLIHHDETDLGGTRRQMKELWADYGAFNEALAKAAGSTPGERLQPASAATTVRVSDGKTERRRRPLRRHQGAARPATSSSRPTISTRRSSGPNAARASKYGAIEIRPIVAAGK